MYTGKSFINGPLSLLFERAPEATLKRRWLARCITARHGHNNALSARAKRQPEDAAGRSKGLCTPNFLHRYSAAFSQMATFKPLRR